MPPKATPKKTPFRPPPRMKELSTQMPAVSEDAIIIKSESEDSERKVSCDVNLEREALMSEMNTTVPLNFESQTINMTSQYSRDAGPLTTTFEEEEVDGEDFERNDQIEKESQVERDEIEERDERLERDEQGEVYSKMNISNNQNLISSLSRHEKGTLPEELEDRAEQFSQLKLISSGTRSIGVNTFSSRSPRALLPYLNIRNSRRPSRSGDSSYVDSNTQKSSYTQSNPTRSLCHPIPRDTNLGYSSSTTNKEPADQFIDNYELEYGRSIPGRPVIILKENSCLGGLLKWNEEFLGHIHDQKWPRPAKPQQPEKWQNLMYYYQSHE